MAKSEWGRLLRRELFIRGGMSLILAAIAAIFLRPGPWVWLVPLGVVVLVLLKWLPARPGRDD